MHKQLIFVDSSVQDYQSLISGINGAEIAILNENLSGIEQITAALANQKDIEALHILSHGSPGSLQIGAEGLNGNNIENFSNQLKQWGNALTENGEILLYGCDVAAGETGLQFIQNLHQLTGADIAASNNKTGNKALGGDWELEVKIGKIETQPLKVPSYSYTLAPTGTADNKGVLVSGSPTSTQIDVLANDTGSGRLNVESIVTGPSNGTAIINDAIYVGGAFTNIGGKTRNYIARLNSDGTVDSTFNPNADNWVYSIALDSSGNLYLGGLFNNIGGQARNSIAKLDSTTGVADATFNPNANDRIDTIVFDSSGNPYVGGGFITIGGQSHNRIAKLNPTTGALDATFNPNATNSVSDLAFDSSGNPYVGGSFTTISGQIRNSIAKLNPITGVPDATFDPNGNGDIREIAFDSSGNPIVVGGFSIIGGQSRNNIAKLDPITGLADLTFNPNADNAVLSIAFDSSGNSIVGGNFTIIGGQIRSYIAKLNSTTGLADATFNPDTSGSVTAIAIDSSGNPIVGGAFFSISGQARNYIAKLDPTTGAPDAIFNPDADNTVRAIAIDPKRDILYTPNANFNGIDTFTYTAKDSSGISSPITVTVLINDSPVLDNSGTPTLNAQTQNDSNSTGTLISTIIANLGGTKITDPNASASQGIAITTLDTANGTWQYTTDGTTWNNAPAVSATNALLLASDANTKIRFVPNPTYNGTLTNAITFAAWDQITGTNGSTTDYTADRTNNTTSSVFSDLTETADITIDPLPAPTITNVSATTADGTYGIGTNIDISVQFSEIVNVTGTPQLSLAGVTPVANYLSGSGSNTLTFQYAVAAGDNSADLDYLSTTALSLSGGTIKNATNNDATLTLPTPGAANSLGANKALVIDTTAPTVTIDRAVSQTDPASTSPINFTVTFSEPVTGFDATDLDLTTSTATGTLTPTITGGGSVYNVAVNGMTGNGNVIASVKANGVTDIASNNNTASTSTDNSVTYDPTIPTVISINRLAASPTIAATATYGITFSEDVTGVDVSDFTLVPTGVTGASIGTLTPVDAKTYQLEINTGTGSGTIGLNLTDDDSITNSLAVALGGTGTGNGNLTGQVYDIDRTGPTGSFNAIADITTAGGTSQSLTVTFSDNDVVDVSSLDSSDVLINWSGGDIAAAGRARASARQVRRDARDGGAGREGERLG